MQRHNLSPFSLVAGVLFAGIAIAVLATDGRFSSYDLHWGTVGIAAAGVVGLLLIVVATRRITSERRIESETGFAADE
ncbi:MAG: hypothetical protein QOG52_2494 [Frankiaceae bacterium]|nr:hypothetical protein [Frankiaceae bacterium]